MIEFENNEITIRVSRQHYIEAKTKDLIEFGYTNLTQEHVKTQLKHVLNGDDTALDVIGRFIKSDEVKEVAAS